MDIQTILVYLIFVGCIIYTIRAVIKSLHKKKESGCGCGCAGCTMAKKNENSSNCCSSEKKRQN